MSVKCKLEYLRENTKNLSIIYNYSIYINVN